MDPLSDVLRAVRLDGAFFYRAEARGPWAATVPPATERVPRVLPESEHVISYHVVVSGSCWGGVLGKPQVPLAAGDAIVFPHGVPHVVSSAEGGERDAKFISTAPARAFDTVHIGPGGDSADPPTTLVCGFLGCDARPFNPLLAALPDVIHVPGLVNGWLAEFPRQVVSESQRGGAGAGGDTMLTRMAELMFVEAVRRHMDGLPPQQTGWLAGLRDPVVGPALARLHADPARAWTLADLARAVAASRTVLAERFSQVVGVPPMQYLTQWRLQLAAEQLSSGSATVAAVGARVGYESEAAFSRAFKRATGHAPAAWRRVRQSA